MATTADTETTTMEAKVSMFRGTRAQIFRCIILTIALITLKFPCVCAWCSIIPTSGWAPFNCERNEKKALSEVPAWYSRGVSMNSSWVSWARTARNTICSTGIRIVRSNLTPSVSFPEYLPCFAGIAPQKVKLGILWFLNHHASQRLPWRSRERLDASTVDDCRTQQVDIFPLALSLWSASKQWSYTLLSMRDPLELHQTSSPTEILVASTPVRSFSRLSPAFASVQDRLLAGV